MNHIPDQPQSERLLAERAQPERKRGEGVKFVYDILRDEILDLVLPPGSLIDEIQLSERLSMSRTPIREALVRLAGEGLSPHCPIARPWCRTSISSISTPFSTR